MRVGVCKFEVQTARGSGNAAAVCRLPTNVQLMEKIRPFNNPKANMEIYNTGTKVGSRTKYTGQWPPSARGNRARCSARAGVLPRRGAARGVGERRGCCWCVEGWEACHLTAFPGLCSQAQSINAAMKVQRARKTPRGDYLAESDHEEEDVAPRQQRTKRVKTKERQVRPLPGLCDSRRLAGAFVCARAGAPSASVAARCGRIQIRPRPVGSATVHLRWV